MVIKIIATDYQKCQCEVCLCFNESNMMTITSSSHMIVVGVLLCFCGWYGIIQLCPYPSGLGVTKVPVRLFDLHLRLTGATTAELWDTFQI